jgi:lipopolysaccharide transport system ATP-binding protein
MGEVARAGRTVVFVSHNMAALAKLCTRGIVLDRGRVELNAEAGEAVRLYLTAGERTSSGFNAGGRRVVPRSVEIVDAHLERDGCETDTIIHGDKADLIVTIDVKEQTLFSVELLLRQQEGLPIAFAPSGLALGWELELAPGRVAVRCSLPPWNFASGTYSIDVILANTGRGFLDYIESALRVSVDSAAVGPRNWQFSQAGGQGCYLWDVHYTLE